MNFFLSVGSRVSYVSLSMAPSNPICTYYLVLGKSCKIQKKQHWRHHSKQTYFSSAIFEWQLMHMELDFDVKHMLSYSIAFIHSFIQWWPISASHMQSCTDFQIQYNTILNIFCLKSSNCQWTLHIPNYIADNVTSCLETWMDAWMMFWYSGHDVKLKLLKLWILVRWSMLILRRTV